MDSKVNKVRVKFVEDDIMYDCSITDVKSNSNLQVGHIRNVKWKDGFYYKAKIINIDSVPASEIECLSTATASKLPAEAITERVEENSHLTGPTIQKWIESLTTTENEVQGARCLTLNLDGTDSTQGNPAGTLITTDALLEGLECKLQYLNSLRKKTKEEGNIEQGKVISKIIEKLWKIISKIEESQNKLAIITFEGSECVLEPDPEHRPRVNSNLSCNNSFENIQTAPKCSSNTGTVAAAAHHNFKTSDTTSTASTLAQQTTALASKASPASEAHTLLDVPDVGEPGQMVGLQKQNGDDSFNSMTRITKELEASNAKDVTFSDIQRKKSSKRNWCQYCDTFQTKITRHMAAKHRDIEAVDTYINAKSDNKDDTKKKRREIAKVIINQSNSLHNKSVLNNNSIGDLIPVRRTKNDPNFESHVNCSICGGMFSKKYFYSHKTVCQKRQFLLNNTIPGTPCSKFLASDLDPKFASLKCKVLQNMVKDKIRNVVQKDPLILEYGRRFLKTHIADHQRNYVSCKMRTLGDLVIRASKLDAQITLVEHCVDPTNFDTICEAVKTWSAYDESSGLCQVGSVPRRLVKTLKSCSDILWSEAIKNRQLTVNEQLHIKSKHEKFISLLETDWKMELGCVGDNSLKMKKSLENATMPTENDIKTFFQIISRKIQEAHDSLKTSVSETHFITLTKVIVAFLIAFNSRRPSEVTSAKLSDYLNIKSSNTSLSLSVFNVTAPKNKMRVPIMVPMKVRKGIDDLVKHREFLKINSNLLFCKADGSAYQGTNVLRSFVSNMNLEKPDHFTANGLRHYWATNSQSDPKLKKHMPKFLGHTLETHQKFYEMPMSDIYLNIMGPIFEGHCLPEDTAETINNPENCTSENESIRSDTNEKDLTENVPGASNFIPSPKKLRKRHKTSVLETTLSPEKDMERDKSTCDDTDEDPDYELNLHETPTRKRFISTKKRRSLHNIQSSSSDSDESLTLSTPPIKKNVPWITPEKEEIFQNLGRVVLGISPPKRGQISQVHKNSKLIKDRHSLQMLRIEVSKYHTKKKVLPSPVRKRLLSKENKTEDSL